VCLVCLCALARFGPRTINIVIETYMLIKAYQVYIYLRFTKQNIECKFCFELGGAYSLEDGLAPSGGEGWAPPHACALMMMFILFCLTPCFMLIVCTNLWQRNALALIL